MSSSAILLGLLILMATFAIGFLIGRSSSSWPGASGRAVVWRILKPTLVVSGLFLLAIQLIPYGRAHANPPVLAEPAWDSPATRDLAVRACFDCHSNETVWPWYSNIAPVSWLVQRDVDGGRNKANATSALRSWRNRHGTRLLRVIWLSERVSTVTPTRPSGPGTRISLRCRGWSSGT